MVVLRNGWWPHSLAHPLTTTSNDAAERLPFAVQVIDLVMATDMKQHFTLLSHFNSAHRLSAYNKEVGPWALAAEPAKPIHQ